MPAENETPRALEPHWPEGLEQGVFYARQSDNGDGTVLRVLVGPDGDAYVSLTPGPKRGLASARFCTGQGGGRAPRVRQALLWLAEAIRLDNESDPRKAVADG